MGKIKDDDKQKHPYDEEEYGKMLTRFSSSWVLYILKNYTDRDHPKSKKDIHEMISRIINIDEDNENGSDIVSLKTIERRVEDMVELALSYDEPVDDTKKIISEIAYQVLGGIIRSKIKGKTTYYYFEPILDNSDVSMICASIRSNHYLSPEETDYLSTRTEVAFSYSESNSDNAMDDDLSPAKLPSKPRKSLEKGLPIHNSVTLDKINTIYSAIKHGYKLSLYYGTYHPRDGKIHFVPKDKEKELVVNPYAMLSQNGKLYLLSTGTKNDPKHVNHYRIDRLFSVDFKYDGDGNPEKRDILPPSLRQYYNKKQFDSGKYASTYPYMAYPDKEIGVRNCEFACCIDNLSTVIDYFGDKITIKPGNSEDQIIIQVNADYNNVLFFCTQLCTLMAPLSPPELVRAVRENLESALKRLPE